MYITQRRFHSGVALFTQAVNGHSNRGDVPMAKFFDAVEIIYSGLVCVAVIGFVAIALFP